MKMIKRSLELLNDEGKPEYLSEEYLLSCKEPIVILGEPGLGKTELCRALYNPDSVLLSAGQLYRSAKPAELLDGKKTIIIDGLDEIASATQGGALDAVLKRLAHMGHPHFILSCRSIDWQSAVYRHKISEDYGLKPCLVTLQPLSNEEALELLEDRFPEIDANAVIVAIKDHGLAEMIGNPLTVRLIGEAVKHRGDIPAHRTEMLEQACRAMIQEKNPAHLQSDLAYADKDDVLDSAGAMFAAMLLTGSSGLYGGPGTDPVDGYVSLRSVEKLPFTEAVHEAANTRLFIGQAEDRHEAVHRVVAEYLGARWLSKCLSRGVSPNRLLQLLHYHGGVPTSLRGLHAWLAHFHVACADRVINADPLGVFLYGDRDTLPLAPARKLLEALKALAAADPFFREQDRDGYPAPSIARSELKDDILGILIDPDRPFHLSSLLLDAMYGTSLVPEVAQELCTMLVSTHYYFGERTRILECLVQWRPARDWSEEIRLLRLENCRESSRLLVDIIGRTHGKDISAEDIAATVLTETGLTEPGDDDEKRASSLSSSPKLVKLLPADLLADVLDVAALLASAAFSSAHWDARWNYRRFVETAAAEILTQTGTIEPDRFWAWHGCFLGRPHQSSSGQEGLADALRAHPELRRQLMFYGLFDPNLGKNLWMRSFSIIQLGYGFSLDEDTLKKLLAQTSKPQTWTDNDKENWKDLVRLCRSREGMPDWVSGVVEPALALPELSTFFDEECKVKVPKWQVEEEARQRRYEAEQELSRQQSRRFFEDNIDKVRAGDLVVLRSAAQGYLGLFSDLDRDMEPRERLDVWLSPRIAQEVRRGFVAALGDPNLPTAEEMAASHVDGRPYYAEWVLLCGMVEQVKNGANVTKYGMPTLISALIAWGYHAPFERGVDIDLAPILNAAVFADAEGAATYLETLFEPQLSAKGDHLRGFYGLARRKYARPFLAKYSFDWLSGHEPLPIGLEGELLDIVLAEMPRGDVVGLIRDRVQDSSVVEQHRDLWLSAGFVADHETFGEAFEERAKGHQAMLFAVMGRCQDLIGNDLISLDIEQCGTLIRLFGAHWENVDFLEPARQGSHNPRDAAEFLRRLINDIGANPSREATDILTCLASEGLQTYQDHIKHVLSEQKQLHRNQSYQACSVRQIVAAVTNSLPATVDDLKAYLLDHFETLKEEIRGSDVNVKGLFWRDDGPPKIENDCRDVLITLLRPGVFKEIQLVPENQLAELKRVDINAFIMNLGVPIEIKGQWHPNLWTAAATQLDRYTQDWRAHGRGIYLVLWFGKLAEFPKKNIRPHPDGLEDPSSADELYEMLRETIPDDRRGDIEVTVLDLSRA